MAGANELTELTAGMPLIYNGNCVTYIPQELASKFQAGDRVVIVNTTGDLLHIPSSEQKIAANAVAGAADAFTQMSSVSDIQITHFFDLFSQLLETDDIWLSISDANAGDVKKAQERGRSTTRLVVSDKMRRDMISGLREWRDTKSLRGKVIETIPHNGWTVDLVTAPLGVVGFVFEGRPNVFADATGVLRGGNTVVFRIGSDALGTAKAIMQHAVQPALTKSGLPEGAVVLVESASHAAGWALFSDNRLSLAVARGSGRAVDQLGSVARQAGIPVSLHGTGGAWIIADESADPEKLRSAVIHSLDRKVCNTLNVICLPRHRTDLHLILQAALIQSGSINNDRGFKLHVVEGDDAGIPAEWFTKMADVHRASGIIRETLAESLPVDQLGKEWEWEQTPELTLKLVDNTDQAVALFNLYSPQFVASLISEDDNAHKRFYNSINAPFIGNGFTRWVDGQYALNRPELGLSNWQFGRLFARGAILSGDGIFTVRTRVTQTDPNIRR